MGRHPHRGSAADDRHESSPGPCTTQTLTHLARRTYPTLSGGERQRVTFARVLAQETPLLLLDEPTSSLDLHHQEQLMTLARSLVDRGGTVVAVLHDLNLAAAYADRIVLLDRGAAGRPRTAVGGPPRGPARQRLRPSGRGHVEPGAGVLAARRPGTRLDR